jgi:uncharacterized damage-inducible protein DinB
MYRRIEDFLADWKEESASSQKLMDALTDASLAHQVTPEGRNLGYLAWHIALSISEMANRAGLKVEGPAQDSSEPAHAAEIAETYRKAAGQLAESVKANWNDASLDEEVDMYGQMWKKGYILVVLLRHEGHHRGQMTVLMRQAGLKVPGIYGPSREEWSAYGMPEQR